MTTQTALPIGRAEIDLAILRLEHARKDSRNHPVAYPILARFDEMERTPNGFVAVDPETVVRRIDRTLAKLRPLSSL